MRVQIVQGEARMASMLRRGLSEDGYSGDVASDGIEDRICGLDLERMRGAGYRVLAHSLCAPT